MLSIFRYKFFYIFYIVICEQAQFQDVSRHLQQVLIMIKMHFTSRVLLVPFSGS
ncbi:hypothetical protein CHK_2834 [Christensenella hongkongensis]|uniref:Uncharacterized protein n=1 Tax=Christensenella hongkongensis TaxID=270498 RepID=A0A0M2NGQ8_9FIRM|nr:hypothetical protein CHK_2834 [Christensenella hongkongensis]